VPRQQLQGELKNLQAIIQEGTQLFDETLMQLFMHKVQAELAVFQVSYSPPLMIVLTLPALVSFSGFLFDHL